MLTKIFISLLFTSTIVIADDSIYEKPIKENLNSIYENYNQSNNDASAIYSQKITPDKNINPEKYGNHDFTGQTLDLNWNNLDKISYTDSKLILSRYLNLYKYNVGLSVLSLTTDYSPTFVKMFMETSTSKYVGAVHFNLDQKLYGDKYSLNYLTGLGVSYFRGSGFFVGDANESETRLTLWLLPVDFGVAGAFNFSSHLRLLVGGGLSGMLAIQSRSDLDEDSKEKTLFQLGYGPFFTTKLNIGINQFFSKYGLRMLRDYGITNTFLNLEYRFQHYSNFKDDFSVKGSSFGGGISFNFL